MTHRLSSDTSLDATDAQLAIWRSMTPAARLAQAASLTRAVLWLEREGLRRRHPWMTAAELHLAAIKRRLGPELTARVYSTSRHEP